MKAILKILLFKFFEVAIQLIAEKNVNLKGWHVEVNRDTYGYIQEVCLTRKPKVE